MKKFLLLVVALLATTAEAQFRVRGGGGSSSGGGGSGVGTVDGGVPANGIQQTMGVITLFVQPDGGSNNNSCVDGGTLACSSLEGALAKVPKFLRHLVDITLEDNLSHTGANISGFTCSPEVPVDGGYLRIHGNSVNATVATGSATGTVTSATQGSNQTFGTLVDSTQTWTSNDLKGKWVYLLTGTGAGQQRVIDSNTGTSIGIEGTWTTTPTSSTTYAIRQNNARISTGVIGPVGPGVAASGSRGINLYSNNQVFLPSPCVELAEFDVDTATMTAGVQLNTAQGITMNRVRVFQTTGTAVSFSSFSASSIRMSDVVLQQASASGSSAATFNVMTSSTGSGTGASIVRSLIESNLTIGSVILVTGFGTVVSQSSIRSTNAAAGTSAGIIGNSGPIGLQQWNVNNLSCASTSASGLLFIADFVRTGASAWGGQAFNISGCGTAVSLLGRFSVYVFGASVLTGTTTGVFASLGANIQVATGATVSGGTQDYLLDSIAYTSAQLAAASPQVVSNPQFGSFILRQ